MHSSKAHRTYITKEECDVLVLLYHKGIFLWSESCKPCVSRGRQQDAFVVSSNCILGCQREAHHGGKPSSKLDAWGRGSRHSWNIATNLAKEPLAQQTGNGGFLGRERVKFCLFEERSWHSGNQASWPFSLATTNHTDLLAGAWLSIYTVTRRAHPALAPGREIITAC